jgi:hypothetical protein
MVECLEAGGNISLAAWGWLVWVGVEEVFVIWTSEVEWGELRRKRDDFVSEHITERKIEEGGGERWRERVIEVGA